MNRRTLFAVLVGALAAVVLPVVAAEGANGHANYRAVCPGPPAGYAHCHELVVTDRHGNPLASTSPTGLSPATIKSAYDFSTSSTAGAGQTIAIVDAYDDPNAESDLAVFSTQYGLPACTTANGCFTKVNQNGGSSTPHADSGWALEISLDVQWAHAIAPGAKILLVEARRSSLSDLFSAESYAKSHADYVSNSWGASEFSGENLYDTYFSQPGVSVFVSSGDAGLPAEYPSASPAVISVGGTTLHFDGSGAFTSETGWSLGGGGCSVYETATSAQAGFSGYSQVGCGGRRATPDVALDADPASGVSVYDSTPYNGQSGWFTVGGTSASSPMWAARAADEGTVVDANYVYGNHITFRDITSGNNGAPCLSGYDLCSGRGSWTGGSAGGTTQPSLSISGGGTTVAAGAQSAAMTVSISQAPTSDLTVTLSSSSSTATFSPASVTIPGGGTTSDSFTYTDTSAGTQTLTASATGATSGTTTVTVTAAALASISVSPGSASVQVGGTQDFTAAGADRYGNPVGVSDASWSTDVGSVSPASGSSTTFTAGSTTGSGSVTATVGSISGNASVTVTAAPALSAPTGLTASAKGKHIGLSWQDDGSATTYDVYRGTSSGGESLYAQNVTSTSDNDMGVNSGTTYYYYVTAVAADGTTQSAPSNEVSATAR